MDPVIGFRLMALEAEFNAALDLIYYQSLAQFRWLAKSVGQRTREDWL